MVKLSEYAHGGGCGCKVAPAVLQTMLSGVRQGSSGALIVGNAGNDDASVWDLGNGQYLLSTTDFFLPVVDDAYTFGRIAAVNALSDIYAMGGRPAFALAVLGWPVEQLGAELAAEVLKGGAQVCAEAGIPLAGGHTIDTREPFFGLVVNGFCRASELKTNAGGKPGDLLYLSKPLGTGIITSASKRGVLTDASLLDAAIASMCRLNQIGEAMGKMDGVHALTDVTGFGLAGHLIELCRASNIGALVNMKDVPRFEGLEPLLNQFVYPDMTMRNFNAFRTEMSELPAEALLLLCDPQTSGGLLIAADPQVSVQVEALLKEAGFYTNPIGALQTAAEPLIFVQ